MRIPIAALVLSLLATTASAASGPTLAVEDTMRTSVPEVLVRAPRVTLAEILDRVARGETRRDSLILDQSFTAAIRVVRDVIGKKTPQLFEESVWKVYRKKPDKVRGIKVREWSAVKSKDKEEDQNVEVNFSPGMGEEIVNFAFRPEARRDFRYKIVERNIAGDHLIYRIHFEPVSLLDPTAPSGEVWIDTNDFVIVREELSLRQSPVPILIKGLHRMVIERHRIDGHWVLKRVLMRGEFTLPIPKFGRSFDFGIVYSDYKINSGLSDSLFTAGSSARRGGATVRIGR